MSFLRSSEKYFLPAAMLIFFYAVVINAWVTEDAYITLRTVDNFVNGKGLVWNPGERVQVYTHPLWMFCVSFIYFFIDHGFLALILLSFLALGGFLFMAYRFLSRFASGKESFLVLLLVLMSSKAFMDYTTSGLENVLSFFLLASFLIFFRSIWMDSDGKQVSARLLFYAGLLGSLIYLNRQDHAVLVFPFFLYILIFMNSFSWFGFFRNGLLLALGFLPVFFWFLFSLFYYGIPVPNTAFAKLNTGISSSALALQGLKYFYNSLRWDPMTLLSFAVFAGMVFYTMRKKIFVGHSTKKFLSSPRKSMALLMSHSSFFWILCFSGILLYNLYIVRIGGDFMSGRFFAAPFVFTGLFFAEHFTGRRKWIPALMLFLAFLHPLSPLRNQIHVFVDSHGVADEKGVYYGNSSLRGYYYYIQDIRRGHEKVRVFPGAASVPESFKNLHFYPFPDHLWARYGFLERYRERDACLTQNVGYFGYFAGSDILIVDQLALTEPLLARLPVDLPWRIGHFQRRIPPGYIETVRSGDNRLQDPGVQEYYENLQKIISGPLFSRERMSLIFSENFGSLRNLLDDYQSENDSDYEGYLDSLAEYQCFDYFEEPDAFQLLSGDL